MAPRGLSHLEVTVRDLGRSLSFYRDLLGMRVFQEGNEQDAARGVDYSGIYERPDGSYGYAMLSQGADAPVIVLIAPDDPTGTSIKIDQVGITHFGIWVDGLDAVYDDLRAKGVEFMVPPHELMSTPAGVVRSAFCVDPDGIIVQLDEMSADG